ncbi:C40 family peptidase [Achromobacter veterisilvae]|jgi:cell wall-associated NlpC family hydrolase|uniref:C40 family peptidase n=1 Tax=Achromobacter veterisilvae TaxID=2069367 RepID=A0A446CER0_9BURK|nr:MULTISPECIES: C40 family peptidase [Achromobacter]MCW0207168.1 C40 family peptidase [Achromobacter sp.]SSW66366.1 Murein DD-endopeptidase MepH [Achromobacter veterisilvae]
MTPPTRKARIANFRIPVFLSAPIIALTLSWIPDAAQASLRSEQARPTLNGLRLAQEPTVPTLRDRVVQAGLEAIGTPYSWGGDDAEGFDCSGLVLYVFREIAGLELPRTARAQRTAGESVGNKKELRPGDLVFFATRGRGVTSHVGIYIGQNKFVHAPRRGTKVRVDEMQNSYWTKRYVGARRYLDTKQGQMLAQASPR